MIRKPAVAGQFYPGRPEELRAFVAGALRTEQPPSPAFGVVVPHAGYVYSGAVAGAVFARVEVPDRVLLLGPNHTGMGTAASILTEGAWDTPLGRVPVDQDLAEALGEACPLLKEDSLAHSREHSLEVQLPFLQVRNPQVHIVPITFMLRRLEDIRAVGVAVAKVLAQWETPVLIVASSDMTHYETATAATAKDRRAIDRVLELDATGLLATTREHHITMCGVVPTAVMLFAAAAAGCTGGKLVKYATSGDASGDYDQVVGYAGVVVR